MGSEGLKWLRRLLEERVKGTEWEEYVDQLWMEGLRVRAFSTLCPRPGWRVLDVGCGDGWSTIENALVYRDVYFVGVDLYEAWEAWVNAGLFKLGNCEFAEADALRMEFSEAFDAAMAFLSLGNICSSRGELVALFKEVWRALRPNGRLLIVEPFREDFKEPDKLDAIYEVAGLKGRGEERETILSLGDTLDALRQAGFKAAKICKHVLTWRVSREELLRDFGLAELPVELEEYYYRDKPGRTTIIVAVKA